MSKDMMQDKLKQLKDAVKQRWGVLTDKDLDTVDGKLDQLPGLLQEKYGYTREQAGNGPDCGKRVLAVTLITMAQSFQ